MADYKEKDHLLHGEQGLGAAEPSVDKDVHTKQEEAPVQDLLNENTLNAAAQGIPDVLPVLPVRDVVIFNYMTLPLFIGREKSVQAVESALKNGRHLLVCAQREESTDDPAPADLYNVGTVVQVMRMLKMPDSRVKILVQGVSRARVTGYSQVEPYLEARIETLPEIAPQIDATVEALLRSAREQSEKVLTLRGLSSPDVLAVLQGVEDPGRLADLIAANMRMKIADAQRILERLTLVNTQLQREVEVATVQARIQSSAREGMDKAQKDYFLREQLKAIRQELGENEPEGEEDLESLKKALDKAGLPKDVRQEADKQLRRLSGMHADSSEANVVRTYLDWLVDLPWKKLSRDRLDIAHAKEILDEDHCGLDKIKDRILEFLSVRKLNPQSKGPILCFAGPPGVGKTSLGRSIARALGRKFQRLSLGGMHDEAEIRGHRRTYIGAMPGRIIQAIKQAGTRNPVIVLDEVDKLGTDFRGDPSSALLEVLDPEQNHTFSDHYLNVPFDLSKVMFLCTANHLETIPAALRDRMEVISLPGYTLQEKVEIARKHGLTGMKIACVTGDDLLPVINKYMDAEVWETHEPLSKLPGEIVSANAYMGVEGILKALEQGADGAMVISPYYFSLPDSAFFLHRPGIFCFYAAQIFQHLCTGCRLHQITMVPQFQIPTHPAPPFAHHHSLPKGRRNSYQCWAWYSPYQDHDNHNSSREPVAPAEAGFPKR